jgi:hypothetical protein
MNAKFIVEQGTPSVDQSGLEENQLRYYFDFSETNRVYYIVSCVDEKDLKTQCKIEFQKELEQLKMLKTNGDTEADHCIADDILISILTKLGYTEIVKAYEEIYKWYA